MIVFIRETFVTTHQEHQLNQIELVLSSPQMPNHHDERSKPTVQWVGEGVQRTEAGGRNWKRTRIIIGKKLNEFVANLLLNLKSNNAVQ